MRTQTHASMRAGDVIDMHMHITHASSAGCDTCAHAHNHAYLHRFAYGERACVREHACATCYMYTNVHTYTCIERERERESTASRNFQKIKAGHCCYV
jgi:hypothetical protein